MRQTIIIGSGPAGYTAESYAGRACLNPLLVASSVEAGGELVTTTEVEKFPGFRTASWTPPNRRRCEAGHSRQR